jgi:hypothetical protein
MIMQLLVGVFDRVVLEIFQMLLPPRQYCPSPWAFRQRTGVARLEAQCYCAADLGGYWIFIQVLVRVD